MTVSCPWFFLQNLSLNLTRLFLRLPGRNIFKDSISRRFCIRIFRKRTHTGIHDTYRSKVSLIPRAPRYQWYQRAKLWGLFHLSVRVNFVGCVQIRPACSCKIWVPQGDLETHQCCGGRNLFLIETEPRAGLLKSQSIIWLRRSAPTVNDVQSLKRFRQCPRKLPMIIILNGTVFYLKRRNWSRSRPITSAPAVAL